MRTLKSLILLIVSASFVHSQKIDSSLFSVRDSTIIYLQYDEANSPVPLTYICREITKDSAISLIHTLEKNRISYLAEEVTFTFETPWNELSDVEKKCYLNAIDNIKDNIYFKNRNYFPKSIKVNVKDLKPEYSNYDNSNKEFNKLYIYHIESIDSNIKKFGFISDYNLNRRWHASDQHKKEMDELQKELDLLYQD